MVCIDPNQGESQFDTLFNEFRKKGSLWNDYCLETHTTYPFIGKTRLNISLKAAFMRYYALSYWIILDLIVYKRNF
jgi:hypothetical protein